MGLLINVVLKRTEQDKLNGIKMKVEQLTGQQPTIVTTGSDPTMDARNATYNRQIMLQNPNIQPNN